MHNSVSAQLLLASAEEITGIHDVQIPESARIFFNATFSASGPNSALIDFECYPSSHPCKRVEKKLVILGPGQELPDDNSIDWSDINCVVVNGQKFCFCVQL